MNNPQNPSNLGPQTYEQGHKKAKDNKQPWIISVGSKWCGACQQFKKIVRELEAEGYKFNFTYLDMTEPEALALLEASSSKRFIPHWWVFKHNGERFDLLHEAEGIDNLRALLKRYSLK